MLLTIIGNLLICLYCDDNEKFWGSKWLVTLGIGNRLILIMGIVWVSRVEGL